MLRRLFVRMLLVAGLFLTSVWLLSVYHANKAPPELAAIEGQIDRIVVEKAARKLVLFQNGQPVREFKIALGFTPQGTKQVEGDGKTPEGVFRIDRRNPKSAYHLSLGIDYPQKADRDRANKAGVNPGGDIFIHGQPNRLAGLGTLPYDWTAGCISVSDEEIEEIWRLTPLGTIVEIKP